MTCEHFSNGNCAPLPPPSGRLVGHGGCKSHLEALAAEEPSECMYAGLRRGEIVNLRWDDVDLESGVLRIRNYASGEERHRTKNEEDRIVPLRPRLAAILRKVQGAHLARGGLPELVLPTNRQGTAITSFQGAWRRLLKRCGLRYRQIQCLRHTCASHMVMAGVPLISVARFLGHKSTKMTERYAHLAPEHMTGELRRVELWHGEPTRPPRKSNGRPKEGGPAGPENALPPGPPVKEPLPPIPEHPRETADGDFDERWHQEGTTSLEPKKKPEGRSCKSPSDFELTGAGDGSWTHDNCVGNAVLYR